MLQRTRQYSSHMKINEACEVFISLQILRNCSRSSHQSRSYISAVDSAAVGIPSVAFGEKDQRLLQADRIADRSFTSCLPFCRARFLHQGGLLLDAACGNCTRSQEHSQRQNHLSAVAQTSVCNGKKSRQDLGSKSIKGKLTIQNSSQPHICVVNFFYMLWRIGIRF